MQSSYQAIPAQMKLRPGFVYEAQNSVVGRLEREETQETIETSTNSLGKQSNPPKATLVASISSADPGFVGSPMALFESLKQHLPPEVYDKVYAATTLFSLTGSVPGNKYMGNFIADSTNLA
eukprot:4297889-Ditylum_brightwellii.AAC.1